MKYLFFFLLSIIYCADKPTVYFTKTITPQAVVQMFQKLNVNLQGKVGLKVHSGEPKGPYFLRPDFLQPIYDYTKGTFIECNVAYTSDRLTTKGHMDTLKTNGWLDNNRRFEIMDAEGEDIILEIPDHNMINITYAGKKLYDYKSCLVLSHFKGHQMGGFGGALKQLSIGFGSTKGKTWIHTAGKSINQSEAFRPTPQENFTASMGDAAWAIHNYFTTNGGIAYINVLANISIDCDCAGTRAKAPEINNIGILASTDPVAIDQACLDMIKKTSDPGTQAFLDRVAKKMGENTIAAAVKLGVGKREYNLEEVTINASIYLRMNLLLLLLILFV